MNKVDVFELARTGACVDGALEVARLARLAPMLARPGGELKYRVQGCVDAHGRAAARLYLRADLLLRCDRCGGELPWALDEGRGFFFVRSERELNALPIEVDGDEALLGGAGFDLDDLAEDEAILQVPISPRHPQCAPAAAAPEDGPSADRQRPFEALAKLRNGGTGP